MKPDSEQDKHPLFTANENTVTQSFIQREQYIIRDHCYMPGGGGTSNTQCNHNYCTFLGGGINLQPHDRTDFITTYLTDYLMIITLTKHEW